MHLSTSYVCEYARQSKPNSQEFISSCACSIDGDPKQFCNLTAAFVIVYAEYDALYLVVIHSVSELPQSYTHIISEITI